ncbi:hypothetical protein, partial [Tahibacter caeni]|uniref:hypothetical protein n=1 Tax=Tahibacter caeni TaxID=1453545 RepID=UPI002148DE74
ALADSLPAAHPRRARLELVRLRIRVANGDCAGARGGLQSATASLATGGPPLLPDLASAQLLLARCLPAVEAATARTAAMATLARLPYLPRRLRAEQAALRP